MEEEAVLDSLQVQNDNLFNHSANVGSSSSRGPKPSSAQALCSSSSGLWTYLQDLRKKIGTEAFWQFQADVNAKTFPGDHEDQTLVASYVFIKLKQEAHRLKTWGRPTGKVDEPLRWLIFFHPRLSDDGPLPSQNTNTSVIPDSRNIWIDGRYGNLDQDEDIGDDFTAAQGDCDTASNREVHEEGKKDLGNIVWPQTQEMQDRMLHLPRLLEKYVVGQKEAVHLAADTVQLCYAGLHENRGPLGTLLFVGPTGVGKTELAKALARVIFASETNLFRVDMSAFKVQGDISTLIGAPLGYQDSAQGGSLTGFFSRLQKNNQFGGVVLLDEVEKAHSEVIDLFLPAFDEGYLVDGRGVRHDCSRVLFIMTSNLGSDALSKNMKEQMASEPFTVDRVEELVRPFIRKHLRPELIGRMDGVAFFTPLSSSDVRAIVCMQLEQLKKRFLAATKVCTLAWDESVVSHVTKSSLQPEYGARELKRILRAEVAVPLTKLLLVFSLRRVASPCQLHISFEDSLFTAHIFRSHL